MTVRPFVVGGTLLALVGLGVALWQHRREQAAETRAQASRQQADDDATELRQLAARHLQFVRREATAAKRQPAQADPSGPPDLKSQNPKALRRAIARTRAGTDLRYHALFQAMHLEPDQERKLAAIIEDYELKARDVWEEGVVQGVSSDPALWDLMRPDHEQMKTEVTALVGKDGYQQLADYDRTITAHDFATAAASALYFTETPLSPAQAASLAPALAQISPDYQQGKGTSDLADIDWTNAYPQFNAILTPPQVAVLRAVVDARQTYWKLTPLLSEAQNPDSSAPANNR